MRYKELQYLEPDLARKIDALIDQYAAREGSLTPDIFLDRITDLLPIQKMDFDTVRRRVEGYHYTTERFWSLILSTGRVTRPDVVKRAQLKSLSQYHYLTGSREPANLMLTRDDLLNDPSTALVKLRDDILGLARVLPEILSETPPAAS
jgi:hypothetical protein